MTGNSSRRNFKKTHLFAQMGDKIARYLNASGDGGFPLQR